MSFSLPPNAQFAGIVCAPVGGNLAGAAPYIASLKNAHMAYLLCVVRQLNGATTKLEPKQADSVAGVTKALTNVVPIFRCLDYGTDDSLVADTAAKSYTLDAAQKVKAILFVLDPLVALDQSADYDCVTLDVSTSHADNIVTGLLFVVPRYGPPLSAIAD